MTEEKKAKNLYQKLIEIRKGIEGFKKDATGYCYKYPSGSQVLGSIKENMDKQGVLLEPHLTAPVAGQGGKGFLVTSMMKYVWVNVDDPKDKIEIPWFMVGEQKDASQAFGSGLTYSERYFIMKYFNIPTDEDDPDKNPSGKNTGNLGKGNIQNKSDEDNKKELDDLLDLAFTSEKTRKAFVDSFKGTEKAMIKTLTARINKEIR